MWFQYVADFDSAPEQVEAPSVRASLRRMSGAILMPHKKNGQGAAVLPEEKEGPTAETVGSEEAKDGGASDRVGSQNNASYVVRSSILFRTVTLFRILVLAFIGLGYPTIVLPYYRAASTTE